MNDYLKKRQDHINAGRPTPPKKQYKGLNKVAPKTKAKLDKEKEERGENDTELQKWFRAKMKVMGNTCRWCGCMVDNKNYRFAINSICHLLEKRDTMCPSVKYHPLNFVTLCPDHHTTFDSMTWDEREKLSFWDIIRDRLVMIYPDLAKEERRHFPKQVLDYINNNEPF